MAEESFVNLFTAQELQENSVEHRAQKVNFDLASMSVTKKFHNRPTTAQQIRGKNLTNAIDRQS